MENLYWLFAFNHQKQPVCLTVSKLVALNVLLCFRYKALQLSFISAVSTSGSRRALSEIETGNQMNVVAKTSCDAQDLKAWNCFLDWLIQEEWGAEQTSAEPGCDSPQAGLQRPRYARLTRALMSRMRKQTWAFCTLLQELTKFSLQQIILTLQCRKF